MSGKLYLCATPIGNLEDITFRVIRTLEEVDIIAAEDTRHSIKLLNHFHIKTPMTSYHEFNKIEKGKQLILKLQEGLDIALITDAGMPGISDPGEELVKMCHEAGIEVTALPGASASVTALTVSGLSTKRFCFEAFLPIDKKLKSKILKELENETRTIVLYEAPHRLKKTLEELYEVLGDRKLSLCRELTKKFENVEKICLSQAVQKYNSQEPKGEFVLVVEGRSFASIEEESQNKWSLISLEEHLQIYLDQNIDKKVAMKIVAKDRGVSKREIYQQLLELK